ncbi:MAG: EcsC family protein, partial [Sciscionella sp.]
MTGADPHTTMTPYDSAAWQRLSDWKQHKLNREATRLLPERVRGRVSATGRAAKEKLENLPGAERFEQLFADALRGLTDPAEQLYALAALDVGTASQVNKAAAYSELNKLVRGLAQRHAWQQLNRNSVTKVVQQVYSRLGMRLTQRKLGQAVPVLGVVLGAGLNARLLARVHDDAEHLYRERFL